MKIKIKGGWYLDGGVEGDSFYDLGEMLVDKFEGFELFKLFEGWEGSKKEWEKKFEILWNKDWIMVKEENGKWFVFVKV